ncbi:EAL domain-containing response regulator [Sphingopyxis sp.]|uniref:EAL domain-containing response regulator n=1 Tax=Sphingopyxis sp. TaxID=1908224 RepID=UPI002B48B4D2|nr:EAL domain-containing response regulator [Sphingopyxis sp.]HJS10497.1 EAL domain-containing response regulator [Sphingopyxis sp.]HKY80058.1 EAL domain-containing response regulator [Sphingobium sp.]
MQYPTNILLIDDDAAFGDVLAEGLIDRGCDCRVFTSPGELTGADWQWADFAIVDLQLGDDRDGPQLLRRSFSADATPALILVSGFDPMVLDAAARAVADIGYQVAAALPKPISIDRLTEVVRETQMHRTEAVAMTAPLVTADDLRQALARKEISVVYQPQVALGTGDLAGFEVLARWYSPRLGEVSPELFVSLAEASGLIGLLTGLIVDQVAETAAQWTGDRVPPNFSINLSGSLLDEIDLVDRLVSTVRRHGLPPERIVFELTETATASLRGCALETLTRLRLAGFGLSLDDFGTGENRFERLLDAPITELKLDRRFAAEVVKPHGMRIVRGLAALAHSLGAICVAEGIETEEQLRAFHDAGCDVGQGWCLGRPLSLQAIGSATSSRQSSHHLQELNPNAVTIHHGAYSYLGSRG